MASVRIYAANGILKYGPGDHGELTGLTDDDHTQYAKNFPSLCEGRLTLTSGTAVTTSDVTAATSVYFTPFTGNRIALYDGSNWQRFSFSELTLSVPASTNTNYDVFIYDAPGLTLEAVAWSTDTTRATALVLQNGVYVKSGATGRRYLGTFRTTGSSGQTEDSASKRYLWNYYHRMLRRLKRIDTTNTWTYASASWQAANADSNNSVTLVIGLSEDIVTVLVSARAIFDTGEAGASGIGIDSTTVNSADLFGEGAQAGATTVSMSTIARYNGFPGIGFHTLYWLEYARAGTITFGGDAGLATIQSGLLAEVFG